MLKSSMVNVLTSTKYVLDRSRYVEIDFKAIDLLVSGTSRENLQVSEVSLTKKRWSLDLLLQIIFVFNTVNFCYWAGRGEEKWMVIIDGNESDGAAALFKCIEKEIERNADFLAGDVLADLPHSRLRNVLAGNITIPLFYERLKNLNEAEKIIEKNFGNSFMSVYEKAGNDAVALAELLITYFPSFEDTSNYKGKKVRFYKLAQLNSKMINDALIANGRQGLNNLDKLTAFADYKIPQILRNLEIIKYSKELSDKIDSFVLIEKGSEEEVEIRAAAIWAVEFIRQRLQKKYDFVTASHVDSMLWNKSQSRVRGDKPYHRTLTAAY